MKRKELQIPFFVLSLVIIGSSLSAACSTRSGRLIAEAEALAYVNPDSAARVLALADTSALSEGQRAHLALTQALIHEEKRQRCIGDTVVCLAVTDTAWEFRRVIRSHRRIGSNTEDDTLLADSSLLRAYHYYYRKSFCGTSDDKDVVRRFGRTCYALSRRYDDTDSLLQFDMLIHQAIHAACAAEDWATAYRAYHRWSEHSYSAHGNPKLRESYWSVCQALKCYDLSRDCSQNFLWLINDYGRLFLHLYETDPRNFPLLLRAAKLTCDQLSNPPYPTVYQLIDSVQHAHVLPFQCSRWYSYSVNADTTGLYSCQEVVLRFDRFQQQKDVHESGVATAKYVFFPQSTCDKWFWDNQQKCARLFDIECRNYTAAGLALKASALKSRLMVAVIAALCLALLVLLLLLWNWRNRQRRKHEAERAERAFESARAAEQAERLAEQLRQKDTIISMLRGHIMDKSEILQMLEPGAGSNRRTVIDVRNWREIEATLDTMDNGFVQRLRNDHPQFSEDDIRLCMLTRLKLSNNALASIYSITISAVQHRKQKLKKDGFGVTDPAISLEQVIATYKPLHYLMKRLFVALILLRMSLLVAAQTERATKQERPVWIEVFASIQDSFNKSGQGSSYRLTIMRPDSTVIRRASYGSMSRLGGRMTAESSLGKMELGKTYIVRVECDGYEPTYVDFTVTRQRRSTEMHLPPINLKLKQKRTALGSDEMMETTMKEFAVKASKVQFVWHGDTLIYHADAFNLPQGAMLEDLIRRLPGVELKDNGEITVNGRRVDCLTLNGRDFFRGNNNVLMQNLPYYTVKDLKVYERESELNRYLGRQAERNDYVMDVQLKREYRRGYMANAEAGYGTKDRWLARAFGLRYGDASRMTLIANANNLNENRRPGYNGNWSPANQPTGVKRLERVDADLQFYGPENRWEQTLEGSVEWERGENATRSFSLQEYQQTMRQSTSVGSSLGKRFGSNVNHQFLMRKPFFLNANTSFTWNRNRTWEEDSARVSTDAVDVNRTMNSHFNHGSGWSLGERLWARYKFPWGDDIGLNASGSYSSSRDRRFQDYDLLLFDDASRDHRLHYRRNEGTVHNVHLGATYTLVLPPWWQLELKADFDHGRSQQDNPLWRLEQDSVFMSAAPALGQTPAEMGRLLDDENSQWTDNTHNEGQIGAGLRYSRETYRGNDANFPRSRLDFYTYAGVRNLYESEHFIRGAVDTLMRRHRWSPTVKSTFNYQNNPAHFNVSANYELTQQLPSLSMQAGYRDTSNPLSVSFANPSLRPTTRHSVQGQLSQGIKGYNRGSVNVGYHIEATRNQLAPSLRYNPQTGGYLRTTENVNGNWQLSLTPGATFYVDKNRRHVLSSSFGLTWQDIVYLSSDRTALEPARTVTHRFRLDAKVDYTYRLSTRFDMQPIMRYGLDHGSSSLLNRTAVNARDFCYGLSLHWTLPLDIQLATDAKMYHRRGYGSAEMNTNDLIWNAQLSRALDRRGRFTLKAVAYDLLGQVRLNTYHISNSGYSSTWQRGIPRYVLFSLFYRMDVKPAKR